MARYVCPSCGASYNGKRCRSCNYEHFSEEIAHGGHSHRGEPLVIDGPVRKPIPKKDPFACEETSRKRVFPKREKKQRPFGGLFLIFMLIYTFLPLVRQWGVELEAREAQMETVWMTDPVVLHREGPVTISVEAAGLENLEEGLRIWVKNDAKRYAVYTTAKSVLVKGKLVENPSLYVKSVADAYGLDTLYLTGAEKPEDVTLILEVYHENGALLFETPPINLG